MYERERERERESLSDLLNFLDINYIYHLQNWITTHNLTETAELLSPV